MKRLMVIVAFVLPTMLFAGALSSWRFSSTTSEAAVPFQSANITLENDTNRPGSDYRDFDIQADPNACRTACWNDSACRAYTYVKPGVQGQNAHCWLKNAVPNPSGSNCCVSGYKTSGGSDTSGLEVNINRRGGDYSDFELRSNNPYDCRQACSNDARCASFTYVRPSYFGQYSHCFLKSNVPDGAQDSCCISGVLRSGSTGGGGNPGSPSNFAGTWYWNGWGDRVHLQQNGNQVTGRWTLDGSTISGQVRGNRLSFTWHGGGDGDAYVDLMSDGTVKGRWCRGRGCDTSKGPEFTGNRPPNE